jgi:polyphosphate kinase
MKSQYAAPAIVQNPDFSDPSLYTNRELSWLQFNQRVLDQALEDHHPLLERVKFLAIVCSNLDEFYMVRVATLLKKQRAGIDDVSIDAMTVEAQLAAIRRRVATMTNETAACWTDRLRPGLAEHGIRFLEPDDYTEKTRRFLTSYFRSEIFPLLTPLAFDPGHPFPVISNRSKNLAVVVRLGRRNKFARVKIPPTLPRFVPIPHAQSAPGTAAYTFAYLEDVIRANLHELFPGVDVVSAHFFRVIRDTDIVVPEGTADDLLESVDRTLKQLRLAQLSLLQVEKSMPRRVLNTLIDNFEIEEEIVDRTEHRLDFSDWMALYRLPLPHLKDAPFTPRTLWDPRHNPCVFDDIREQDYLVHHPFDSFSAVEAFVRQASTDPLVVGIKMTLYRIGANSPLIDMLIEAAEAGKQVAVLVELKARFDERNNINWATRLEDAGIHVVYGVEGLKTHCKLCLVVRRELEGIRRYAHIGSGNYNRATSQVYTDLGIFTANSNVVDDVAEVFNYLTGYSRRKEFDQLLVAPVSLRSRLGALIEREIEHAAAGRRGYMIVKNNALTDPDVVRLLYRASQGGVDVDLIVRGACSLRPGRPGISDRIRVRSVVGRWLEHSRVYYFENGGEAEVYLGSADLMERNLDRRVETLCRIADASIARHIRHVILEAYIRDTDRTYVLLDNNYKLITQSSEEARVNPQQFLLDWYLTHPSGDEQEQPFV